MAFPFSIHEAVVYPSLAAAELALEQAASALACEPYMRLTRTPGRVEFRRRGGLWFGRRSWMQAIVQGELVLAPAPALARQGEPVLLRYRLLTRDTAWVGLVAAGAAIAFLPSDVGAARWLVGLAAFLWLSGVPYLLASIRFYTRLPRPRRVALPEWPRRGAV